MKTPPTLSALWLALPLVLAACDPGMLPAEPQLVLHVVTDAPLPPPDGVALGADEPWPLFDRLRFDVYPGGGEATCEGCSRVFSLDRALVDAGDASVGLFVGEGDVVRVRMYRGDLQTGPEPIAAATVEAWIALPNPEDGVEHVWTELSTDDVAVPRSSLTEPAAPESGRPPSGRVGTWMPGQRVPCASEPGPDEACVPGGAFWMGNPRAAATIIPDLGEPRLVWLPPFVIDRTEVSVRAFRESGQATTTDPRKHSGTPDGNTGDDWCTYTESPSEPQDPLPVTCISLERAAAYCTSRGATLPTEAQYEYVAGAFKSSLYIWGVEEPACDDAVFDAVSEQWVDVVTGSTTFVGGCHFGDEIGGVQPVDRPDVGRSVVRIEGVDIVDLVGNALEYTSDRYALSHGCGGPGVMFDPRCPPEDEVVDVAAKGGAWHLSGAFLRASARIDVKQGPLDPGFLGFRCVRPAG